MEKVILLLKYIFIALIQGLAEILPISSSGHLIIVETLLNMKQEDLTFEIFLHFASLIAIIFFFRKRLWKLIKDFFLYLFKKEKENQAVQMEQKENFRYCIFLILATIPAGIIGVLFNDVIEKYLSSLLTIGIFLFVTSLLLFISTKMRREKDFKDLKWYDAFVIGLFQCLGILPGISRSGSCLVGSSMRKLNQNDAAEFTFIMAIPIMLGSAILKVKDLFIALQNTALIIPYCIAFLVTLFVTYFCLKFFLQIIRKQKLSYFSIYCAIAGIVSIILYFCL